MAAVPAGSPPTHTHLPSAGPLSSVWEMVCTKNSSKTDLQCPTREKDTDWARGPGEAQLGETRGVPGEQADLCLRVTVTPSFVQRLKARGREGWSGPWVREGLSTEEKEGAVQFWWEAFPQISTPESLLSTHVEPSFFARPRPPSPLRQVCGHSLRYFLGA